jgi:hypothetical protein
MPEKNRRQIPKITYAQLALALHGFWIEKRQAYK